MYECAYANVRGYEYAYTCVLLFAPLYCTDVFLQTSMLIHEYMHICMCVHMSFSITYDHMLIFSRFELDIMTLPYTIIYQVTFVPIRHHFLFARMLATKSAVISPRAVLPMWLL